MTQNPIAPPVAAAELLRRRKAREGLIAFTEATFPRYRTAAHHKIIAGQLERVETGEVDRLMLLCPPRHGKSELASRRFPAFYLGRHPERSFIAASATADLAGDFGRDVRNLIASQEYAALFPTRLAADSQAKGKWHTEAGGMFYAVGVDGSVMGRGAHVIVIDDPFASMAEAESPAARKRVWDWYTGTAYNRLEPGGAIVVINHRMHEDDLSGRLLAQQAAGGDRFAVVELPALGDDGAALWPEAFPADAIARIRQNTLPRYFSALYQQRPAPEQGTYFQRDWFRLYDEEPTPEFAAQKPLRLYGASDYATKAGAGDFTVHAIVGLDRHDDLFVLDVWRGQAAADTWIDAFCDLIQKWRPLRWAEPRDQIANSLGPFIVKRMAERRAYCDRVQISEAGDKAVKARAFQARAAMGKVWLPARAPWLPELMAELLAFDGGKHDDQVDALSLFGRLLDQMTGARPGRVPGEGPDRWERAFAAEAAREGAGSWRSV